MTSVLVMAKVLIRFLFIIVCLRCVLLCRLRCLRSVCRLLCGAVLCVAAACRCRKFSDLFSFACRFAAVFLVVVALIWRLSFLCLVAEAKAAGRRSCRKVWLLGRVECQKTKKGPYPCGIQSFQNAFKQMRAITYADRGP